MNRRDDSESGLSRPRYFIDENGKEVYRHVGFMDEKAIVNQLKKMGIE